MRYFFKATWLFVRTVLHVLIGALVLMAIAKLFGGSVLHTLFMGFMFILLSMLIGHLSGFERLNIKKPYLALEWGLNRIPIELFQYSERESGIEYRALGVQSELKLRAGFLIMISDQEPQIAASEHHAVTEFLDSSRAKNAGQIRVEQGYLSAVYAHQDQIERIREAHRELQKKMSAAQKDLRRVWACFERARYSEVTRSAIPQFLQKMGASKEILESLEE